MGRYHDNDISLFVRLSDAFYSICFKDTKQVMQMPHAYSFSEDITHQNFICYIVLLIKIYIFIMLTLYLLMYITIHYYPKYLNINLVVLEKVSTFA